MGQIKETIKDKTNNQFNMKRILGMMMAVAAFSLFDFVHAQDDAWTLPYEEHFNIRNSSTEDHPTQETLDDPSLVQTDPNFYRNVLENWELRDGDGNGRTWTGAPGWSDGSESDAGGEIVSFLPDANTGEYHTGGYLRVNLESSNRTINDWLIMKKPVTVEGDAYAQFSMRRVLGATTLTMEVWYGTTPDVGNDGSGWQRLGVLKCEVSSDWMTFMTEALHMDEATDLYFGVRLNEPNFTADAGDWLSFDEFAVLPGEPDLTPDIILSSVTLPALGCNLGEEEISMTITNTLCRVQGIVCQADVYRGSEHVTTLYDTIRDDVFAGEVRTMTFSQRADFSEEGDYRVDGVVSLLPSEDYNAEENYADNYASATTSHVQPLTLPVEFSFFGVSGEEDAINWSCSDPEAWTYDGTAYIAREAGAALVSTCIHLAAGDYVFRYNVLAGYLNTWDGAYESREDYEIRLGSEAMEPDASQWNLLYREEGLYNSTNWTSGNTKFFRFTVDEEGDYQIAMINTTQDASDAYVKRFQFVSMFLDEAAPDLSLEALESDALAYRVPADHLGQSLPFTARVANMGVGEQSGKVTFTLSGAPCGESAEFTIDQDSTITVDLELLIPSYVSVPLDVETSLEASVVLTNGNTDSYAANDRQTVSFIKTDSVWGVDRCSGIGNGVFVMNNNAGYTNLVYLTEPDTITSVTFAFNGSASDTYLTEAPVFDFKISTVDFERGEYGYLGTHYYETSFSRPLGRDTIITIDVPPMLLPAGVFAFSLMQQTSLDVLSIATDNYYSDARTMTVLANAYGFGLSVPEAGGSSIGNAYIRANFGHNAVNVGTQDVMVRSIDAPAGSAVFSKAESIEATLTNVGPTAVTDMTVYCRVDGEELSPVTVASLPLSSSVSVQFTADLSQIGQHEIVVYTSLENDLQHANDTARVIVETEAALDPYVMNFDSCDTYAMRYLNPQWRFIDQDSLIVWYNAQLGLPTTPYAPMAFIVTESDDNYIQSHSGKFALSISPAIEGTGEDWIVSPALSMHGNDVLTFYSHQNAVSLTPVITLTVTEVQVYVSTTGNNVADFTGDPLYSGYAGQGEWARHTVDLADEGYTAGEVYIGIKLVSGMNSIATGVDDIQVTWETANEGQPLVDPSSVAVYPNPADDYVNVASVKDIRKVEMYSLDGRVVYSNQTVGGDRCLIETSAFQSGVYFVKVYTEDGSLVKKVVVR